MNWDPTYKCHMCYQKAYKLIGHNYGMALLGISAIRLPDVASC